MNDDMLRDSLARISDQATPVDFLDRSLSRSKRIGRNRAMIASAAAIVALALAGGLTWQLGQATTNRSTPAVGLSVTPSAAGSPSPSLSPPPSVSASSASSVAGSIVGLPGWLYYEDTNARVLRLTRSGVDTVVSNDGWSANVSPDGASIAYIDQSKDIVVADRDGQHPRTVLHGGIVGWEPVWSPDSQRLLAGKIAADGASVTIGIISVASGTFTPLPHQVDAVHPLWSADGQHLGYANGVCKLGTAAADGGNAHLVPVFGDRNSSANPQQRESCDPYSISPDGSLIAVNQRTGDQPAGDIARDLVANTIIDTRTGNNVTLPVTGAVTAILFQPNGDILVRTTTGGANQLTLLKPDHTIKAQVAEPVTVKNARLLA
jgi:TolB protein